MYSFRSGTSAAISSGIPSSSRAVRLASFGQSMLVGFQQIHHPPDPAALRALLDDYHVLVLSHVPRHVDGHPTVS